MVGYSASVIRLVITVSVLVVQVSCNLTARSKDRLPGEPTMNELMHRRADGRQGWKPPDAAEVSRLEAALQANPLDDETRQRLLSHYYQANDVKNQNRLVLWLIEHAPEAELTGRFIHPDYIPEDYRKGRQLWLQHVKQTKPPAKVLANAATYFEASEKSFAEEIIQRGEKLYPQDSQWAALRTSLYFQAVVGSNGPIEGGVVRRGGCSFISSSRVGGSRRPRIRSRIRR